MNEGLQIFAGENGRITKMVSTSFPVEKAEGERLAFVDDPCTIQNPNYVPAVGDPKIVDPQTMELIDNPNYVPAQGDPTIQSTTRRYFRLEANHVLPSCDSKYYKWQDSEPWIIEASQQEKDQWDLEDAQAEDARQAAKTQDRKDAENRMIGAFRQFIPGYENVTVLHPSDYSAIRITLKAIFDSGNIQQYLAVKNIFEGCRDNLMFHLDEGTLAAALQDCTYHPEIVQ